MKKQELQSRLNNILTRLDAIFEQDKEMIQPRSSTPVPVSLDRLKAYADRFDERRKLHDELRQLAGEPIEN